MGDLGKRRDGKKRRSRRKIGRGMGREKAGKRKGRENRRLS